MNFKKILKIALFIELLAIPFFFVKDSLLCSGVDCGFEGINIIAVYIFPLIGITVFIYLVVKAYESRAGKSSLKPEQKVFHFVIATLILITIIYLIYYLFNR